MIKGIIFDMDGVISDTQKLHSKVESELLKRFNINIIPEEITQKYAGVRTKEFFQELLQNQNLEYNLDLLMKEKWEKMEKLAFKSVQPIKDSIELIKRFSSKNYKLSVASASNLNYVQTVLKKLKIFDFFDFVISGDMVSHGKPDPESFLLAASKMKILPEQCIVIEDGRSGMEAAKQAKMKCIGLVNNKNGKYPTKNLINSLSEITTEYINQL